MNSQNSSLGSPNTSKKLSFAQSFGSIVEEVNASAPLASAQALKKYMSVLRRHERLEMLEFQPQAGLALISKAKNISRTARACRQYH
jgi:hypothetical protein